MAMPRSDHTDYMYSVQVRSIILTQRNQHIDSWASKDNTKDITVPCFPLEKKQQTSKQTKHTNKKFPAEMLPQF